MGSGSEARSNSLNRPPNLSRRRADLTCRACRVNKRKCDTKRPICSQCLDLEIECVYQRPPSRTGGDRDTDLTSVHRRLDRIEADIQDLIRASSDKSQDRSSPRAAEKSEPSSTPRSIPTGRPVCKLPNLQRFCPINTNLSELAYDVRLAFFRDQKSTVTEMSQAMDSGPLNLELSRPCLWGLQRSFADNILKWLPLFSPKTATEYLSGAEQSGYQRNTHTTCIAFLIFAVGAASADQTAYVQSSSDLPGFSYFSRAMSMVHTFASSEAELGILQAKVLTGIYLLLAMRPLLAWKAINQASQECIIVLKTVELGNETPQFRDAFSRIFWICFVLGHELEVCLELPSSGLRAYEAAVPFPTSQFEEEGLYYLSAMAALRKLLMEAVDTVGLNSSSDAPYAPLVILELRKQVEDWKSHLPSSLRFPVTRSRLFDSRKAHLRCHFHSLVVVVTWPFLLQSEEVKQNDHQPKDVILDGASECLVACEAYLQSAEEVLTHKSLESHLVLRGYFAVTIVLIVAFPTTPGHTPLDNHRNLLRRAIQNLSYWQPVPFMRTSLCEMERLARLKGILATD